MTTSAILRLVDAARFNLPGAIDGSIRFALFETAKEFFQRSNVWQSDVSFTAQPNVYDYTLDAGQSNALVNRLLWLEGVRTNTSLKNSGMQMTGVISAPDIGTATIYIPYPPSVNETWYAHFALTVADPTDASGVPTFPDWIAEKYYDTLVSGVLSRMMMQPAKPYTSPTAAVYHARRFREGTNLAKSEMQHGFVNATNTWRYPQTFGSSTQRY